MTDQVSVTNDLCSSIDAKLVQLAEAQATVTILQEQLTEARDKLAHDIIERVRRTKAQIARMEAGGEAGEP